MTSQDPAGSPPAGWYPDPYAAAPGSVRYWDGAQWLSHTQAAASGWSGPPAGMQAAEGTRTGAPSISEPDPASWERASGSWERGAAPASWGRRVAAYLLDSVPFVVLGLLLLGAVGYFDLVEELALAMQSQDPAALDRLDERIAAFQGPALLVSLVCLVLQLVYNVGFHVRTGQTPGKRLLRIRVRMRDADRPPTFRAALLRWLAQFGVAQLANVPFLGLPTSVYLLFDALWPLWDVNRQALHDKAGRTLVVIAR